MAITQLPASLLLQLIVSTFAAVAFVWILATPIAELLIAQLDGVSGGAVSARERAELIVATIPVWIQWPLRVAQWTWGLAEIAVFVDSYERRALHDLIAGTVVVYKVPRVVGSLDGNPPVGSTSAYR